MNGINPCKEIATEIVRAVSPEPTLAEFLLATARATTRPRGKLIVLRGPIDGMALARIILAHDFARLPKQTHLRAIVEEWDHLRVMLETYK
jgi:hypothetical protein